MKASGVFRSPLMVAAVILTGVVFSSSGCRKEKDTIAKIYVYQSISGETVPVSGATVRLRGVPTISPSPAMVLDKTSTTNSSGEAVFDFNDVYKSGQAGVAVVNIDASYGGMTGTGIIKVEQETTSEEAVFIQ